MIATPAQPAVAYLRRSTNRQEQSLADQRREIARWMEAHGYRFAGEYTDDAISGTSASSRPGFQRMIADAHKRLFAAVIVWNSDRFSRGDVTETEHYRYLLREAGVGLHSVTEDYIAKDGIDGDVLRAVKQFQNRQFSVSLSQNTLRGQLSAVLAASDPGRMPPYGYDREITGPDDTVLYRVRFSAEGQRLVLGPDGHVRGVYQAGQSLRKPGKECRARLVLSEPVRVEAVRDIFHWCAEGVGYKPIASRLNQRQVPSPKGKLWQFTTVKAMIENPVYRGDLVWNRRTESKFFSVRERRADAMKPRERSGRVERVDPDNWVVIEGAVPAIVDHETWWKAQQAKQVRAECNSGKGRQKDRWLLSGLLACGCCGQPFWGLRKRKGRATDKNRIVKAYYVCAGRTRKLSTCQQAAHVPAELLESWVLKTVRDCVMADRASVDEAVDAFVASLRSAAEVSDEAPRLKAEIESIEREADAIVRGLDAANLPLVNKRLTELRQRRGALQERLNGLNRLGGAFDEKAARRWATERISLLDQAVSGRRDEATRQVLASYVSKITVDAAKRTATLVLTTTSHTAVPPPAPAKNTTTRRKGGSHVTAIAGAGFEPATSGL